MMLNNIVKLSLNARRSIFRLGNTFLEVEHVYRDTRWQPISHVNTCRDITVGLFHPHGVLCYFY